MIALHVGPERHEIVYQVVRIVGHTRTQEPLIEGREEGMTWCDSMPLQRDAQLMHAPISVLVALGLTGCPSAARTSVSSTASLTVVSRSRELSSNSPGRSANSKALKKSRGSDAYAVAMASMTPDPPIADSVSHAHSARRERRCSVA